MAATARDKPRLNQWTHLAGVWDGMQLRLYVDGQLEGVRDGVHACAFLSEGPFLIGADPSDLYQPTVAEGFFHGSIRAVRLSRDVEYTATFAPVQRLETTRNTIALYDFTIDTGRYAIDRSGHGRHGIIVGAKFVKATD